VQQHLAPRREKTPAEVGVRVAAEEQHLEEQHARGPHGRTTAEHGKMALLTSGCTWKSRNALSRMVTAKLQPGHLAATRLASEHATLTFNVRSAAGSTGQVGFGEANRDEGPRVKVKLLFCACGCGALPSGTYNNRPQLRQNMGAHQDLGAHVQRHVLVAAAAEFVSTIASASSPRERTTR